MLEGELKELLEYKHSQYNCPAFIEGDPISVPHKFTAPRDIEISGVLTATLSWGLRKSIISKANDLIRRLDYQPYDFLINASEGELQVFGNFVHRTFNGTDCIFFLRGLRNIYIEMGSLENAFLPDGNRTCDIKSAISAFRNAMLKVPHDKRSVKHLANPLNNASAKRINMFLRWMVRNDRRGVDFGIWKRISPRDLMLPLDLHTGNVARKLGLLNRKANDWQAVEELTACLRKFDPEDPVKYDFALFGMGIYDKI